MLNQLGKEIRSYQPSSMDRLVKFMGKVEAALDALSNEREVLKELAVLQVRAQSRRGPAADAIHRRPFLPWNSTLVGNPKRSPATFPRWLTFELYAWRGRPICVCVGLGEMFRNCGW
eukprot:3988500-Pyramimonas_sp.AAC.1